MIKARSISLVLFSFLLLTIAPNSHAAQNNELSVISNWFRWENASSFLRQRLNQQAFSHLQRRQETIAQLRTENDWLFRQQQVKQILHQIIGPFPERTPLSPHISGIIQKDGYRVEKVHFQSMPDFYVTGCLFIPDDLKGKTPAILNPIGHTGIAFRSPYYQQVILNLVNKGFIVFAFDPLGQGERLQYYDADEGKSTVGGSTAEHSYFGNQCFLNGISSARYFIWDGMRAIDYLLTREEVDPDRIAVTGLSGGGTQTAYISAFDERVAVAAPACYITSFRRLLESIGPQDAEQNFYREIAMGLDHADFIEVRAPKPTLILATTRDFFSIQGVKETYNEAKRAYTAFGKSANLQMAVDDHVHGYTEETREALYAFMQKHLDLPGDPADEEIEPLSEEELTVTETGQVITALSSKRVFDINKKHTEDNQTLLSEKRSHPKQHLKRVHREAAAISGFQKPPHRIQSVLTGGVQEDFYRIEKYVLHGEGPCIIPLLLCIPESNAPHHSVIYLHPEGKLQAYTQNNLVEELLRLNFLVAIPDLSGIGETGESLSGIKAPFTGLLIGRSLPGFHAGEISRIVNFLHSLDIADEEKTVAVAHSTLCPALLHAAAFTSSISQIALIDPVVSYQSIAMNLHYKIPSWCHVPGALPYYDLADLAACIAPRPLLLLSPIGPDMQPVEEQAVNKEYEITFTAYELKEAQENLMIYSGKEDNSEKQVRLVEWLRKY